MSGTIPLSMTQQFDEFGEPLSGGQLFIIQAGTVSTPQNPYQDAALTHVMPNPITLDAAGRIPQFFLADGYIKIRLADVNGVTQLAADGILVIGPSAGGGGGGGVDPTTIMQVGDMKFRYDVAILAGFVRANGNTIGSSSSSATELADPSAQALFNYLWNKDPNLLIYSGLTVVPRGASSAADWAANRQIALPDFRGYAVSGLDDMGNSPSGRLTSAGFGTLATVLGAVGGGETFVLAAGQIPSIISANPSQGITVYPGGNSGILVPGSGGSGWALQPSPSTGGNYVPFAQGGVGSMVNINAFSAPNSISVTSNNTNGQPHRTLGPRKLITFYLKL
jgi:hypothetical protein